MGIYEHDDGTVPDHEELKSECVVGGERALANQVKYRENYTLAILKKQIQDKIEASHWNELNTGIDQWKHKYLFPFADVSPFPAGTSAESKLPDDITSSTSSIMTNQGMLHMGANTFGMENESVMQDPSTDSKHFFELVHVKY